ncbi:hypothetical protein MICRO116_980003 [Micrococcus sp. 116]|nr:hypothetical protein MICRO116_980003 [Micrococcus sp. 116]
MLETRVHFIQRGTLGPCKPAFLFPRERHGCLQLEQDRLEVRWIILET